MDQVIGCQSFASLTRSTNSTWTTGIAPEIDAPDPAELFNFTRGRFVRDEEHEFAQRRREFNVGELARRAARVVQADRCLSIKKYPDGMYNRILLLSMDNGEEVVAKIPNPNAGQAHFTTASEVATMKFAREVLSTPLPEVYDWCSRAEETPSWASVSFVKFGSLYFAEDFEGENVPALVYTDDQGRRVEDPRFVVGPSTSREMFDAGRGDIDFDRGPWNSLEECHVAIGKREIACIQHVAHLPPSPVSLRGPGLYQPTREKKVAAIDCYLKLLKHLIPTCSIKLPIPVSLSPLYFHARQPQFIDYEGPPVRGSERPKLPPDYAQLKGEAKEAAYSLYLDQSLCAMYRLLVYLTIPKVIDCFEFQDSVSLTLLLLARTILIEGEAAYLAQVCDLEKEWETFPGTQGSAFPLTFTAKERQTIQEDVESFDVGARAMRRLKASLGESYPEEGFVFENEYKEVVDALSRATKEVLSEVEAIRSESDEKALQERRYQLEGRTSSPCTTF
ncbi:hypothetical protein E4U50_005340 [Claviceps purpurea]|nr:hypothetical protein E4U12_000046 [Claviceps purpurea]KAG6204270.1 hypothetical protein E4U50_005340 [Claviceps purpurea]